MSKYIERQKLQVDLQISSFIGFSPGASHYYGELNYYVPNEGYKPVELSRKLSIRGATNLNKVHQDISWEAGMITPSFEDKESLQLLAIKRYIEEFPSACILTQNQGASILPRKILHSTVSWFMNQASKILETADSIGWWDDSKNDSHMEKLYKQYISLFDKILEERILNK